MTYGNARFKTKKNSTGKTKKKYSIKVKNAIFNVILNVQMTWKFLFHLKVLEKSGTLPFTVS